jgi:hypothetical protein
MKEIILPLLSWFLVFVLVLPLTVFPAFALLVGWLVLLCLRHLLPLLAASLLFYVENLLVRSLLRLQLALASVAPLNVFATCLVLLVLILLLQPSLEVIV